MRVLMFGWEFPPHISGGLGTASYGLTKGMAALGNVEVIFVVPKAWGDEDCSVVRLLGANSVPVAYKTIHYEGSKGSVSKIEVDSRIVPYTDPEDFWRYTRTQTDNRSVLVTTDDKGRINFSGKYGPGLLEEIRNYADRKSVV